MESRYSTKPIRDKEGRIKRPMILAPDIEILKALAEFPYLDRYWLTALLNRGEDGLVRRIRSLKRFGYIKVSDSQSRTPEARRQNLYERLCLEVGPKGIEELAAHGIDLVPKTTDILEHQAMASQVLASFAIGAKGNVRFVPFNQLRADPDFRAVFDSPQALTFKGVNFLYRGKKETKDVRPDLPPSCIEVDDATGTDQFFLVNGQVDNSTEPMTGDIERSSIERHLAEMMAIAEQRLYQKQYGFPHMFAPFVFKSETRMHNAMDFLKKMDVHPSAKKVALFHTHLSEPNDYILSKPFYQLTANGVRPFIFGKK